MHLKVSKFRMHVEIRIRQSTEESVRNSPPDARVSCLRHSTLVLITIVKYLAGSGPTITNSKSIRHCIMLNVHGLIV